MMRAAALLFRESVAVFIRPTIELRNRARHRSLARIYSPQAAAAERYIRADRTHEKKQPSRAVAPLRSRFRGDDRGDARAGRRTRAHAARIHDREFRHRKWCGAAASQGRLRHL